MSFPRARASSLVGVGSGIVWQSNGETIVTDAFDVPDDEADRMAPGRIGVHRRPDPGECSTASDNLHSAIEVE